MLLAFLLVVPGVRGGHCAVATASQARPALLLASTLEWPLKLSFDSKIEMIC